VRLPWQRPAGHRCDAEKRLDAVIELCNSLRADSRELVPIASVMTRADPERQRTVQRPDPRADPLFGTKPVTPEE